MERVNVPTWIIFFLVSLISLGCKSDSNAPLILATVADHTISVDDFERKMQEYRTEGETKSTENLVKERILDNLIETELLMLEAKARNIRITKAELESEMKRIAEDFPGQEFEKMLLRKRVTYQTWQDEVRSSLLLKRISKRLTGDLAAISDEAIQKYYEDNKAEFVLQEEVRALHILVDDEQEAFEILALIRKGTPFETVARERSKGPEAQRGGDLDYFPRGIMPEVFDETIFSLQVGKTSRVVSSEYGYHIFKLIDRRPKRTKPLDEVKEQIRSALVEEEKRNQYATWLEKKIKETKIMKNSELLANLN